MMKKVLIAAVAFGTMTSVALAEPRKLADTEMAEVAAGLYDIVFIVPITVINSDANSSAVGVHSQGTVASNAENNVTVNNVIGVDQTTQVIAAGLSTQAVLGLAGVWSARTESRPGTAVGGGSFDPMRAWSMIAEMLQVRFLGRGW